MHTSFTRTRTLIYTPHTHQHRKAHTHTWISLRTPPACLTQTPSRESGDVAQQVDTSVLRDVVYKVRCGER
jgi:hypothetical protein